MNNKNYLSPSPLISIIVPIYNVEQYLSACLDSVLNQTLQNIEIICVNDGSTDGSASIVRKYMLSDPRIMLVEQPNKGLSGARNTGLRHAKGKYVYFMDSDDLLDLHAMETCYLTAEKANADIVCFDAVSFKDKGYVGDEIANYDRSVLLREVANKPLAAKQLFRQMLNTGAMRPSVCLAFVKRDVLVKNSLIFKERLIHEDELFTPILYMLAKKAIYIPHIFFHRRVRNCSIMTTVSSYTTFVALCDIIAELMAFAHSHCGTQSLISQRCYQLMSYADGLCNERVKEHISLKAYRQIMMWNKVHWCVYKIKKYCAI